MANGAKRGQAAALTRLEALRHLTWRGAHAAALEVAPDGRCGDIGDEIVRVTYRAANLEALGRGRSAVLELERAVLRERRTPMAVGRFLALAAAISERCGDPDAAQARWGRAVTAYGRALHSGASRDWVDQARGWALLERARLLDGLGRPLEAQRLRTRGFVALRRAGVAPIAA